MSTELAIVLAVLSGVVGIGGAIIGLSGWKRNAQKDATDEAKSAGEIIGTLKCVREDVGKIEGKIDKFTETMNKMGNEITAIKGTVDGLVCRVDKLEKRRENAVK